MTPIVAIDCETSGLDPDRHEVWEFAGISADHDPEELTLTVTDTVHYDIAVDLSTAEPMALRIGGYYTRRQGAVLPGATRIDPLVAAATIARLLADRHVVGANPAFDLAFLTRLLTRHGQAATHVHHLIDVSPLVAGYLQGVGHGQHAAGKAARHCDLIDVGVPPYRSTALAEAVDVHIDEDDRHTALGDARWALAQYAAVYGLQVIG